MCDVSVVLTHTVLFAFRCSCSFHPPPKVRAMSDTGEEKYYDSTAANFNLEQYCERRGLDPATVTDAKQVLMQEWREPALSFHNIQVRDKKTKKTRKKRSRGTCV